MQGKVEGLKEDCDLLVMSEIFLWMMPEPQENTDLAGCLSVKHYQTSVKRLLVNSIN